MEEYETLSLRASGRNFPSASLVASISVITTTTNTNVLIALMPPHPLVFPSPTNRLSPSSIKGRCKNLMSRMGRHRRHSSADFSYHPLSYSLNFQDNGDPGSDHYDEFPVRSFASRLPLSPPGSRRNLTTLIPPCSTFRKMPMVRTSTSQLGLGGSSSRAAAVAEVRKSLQEEDQQDAEAKIKPWNKLEEMNLPKTPRVVNLATTSTPTDAEMSSSGGRRNINLFTPTRMAAPDIVRRSYEYEYEDVSPALVVSSTQRQVLVELC